MIVAVGLDLVEIARVRRAAENHPDRFLRRCFHPDELADLVGRKDVYPGLAARFAAKEAFAKVWQGSLGWRDVWIAKEGPRPVLKASPGLAAAMEREGLVAHVSLSHAVDHAAAVVVLERRDTEGPA
jgi:holo-[acyl-carrier protein] synthase